MIFLSLGKDSNFITYGAYFSAGVGFFYYWEDREILANRMFLFFTFIACLYSSIIAHNDLNLSNYIIGIIILIYFGCFYFLLNGYQLPISNKLLTTLGGITYPLYLLHQELGYSLLQYVGQSANLYVTMCVLITMVMILLAFIVYRYFEQKAHVVTSKQWDFLFKKKNVDPC